MAAEIIQLPSQGGSTATLLIPPKRSTRRRGSTVSKSNYEKAIASRDRALARGRALRAEVGPAAVVKMAIGFLIGLILSGILDAVGLDDLMGFDSRYVIGAAIAGYAFMGKSKPGTALMLGAVALGVAGPAAAETVEDLVVGTIGEVNLIEIEAAA